MKSGIIHVDKEKGWTSSDVVVKLRHLLHEKKVGHAGTLDPGAQGVLPVCVGSATQLSEYIMDKKKVYIAQFIPGITTDTEDITGNVISRTDAEVSLEQVREACSHFVGEIKQIPPMYSAVRYNGKKLYELARSGRTVERKPRCVTVYSIEACRRDDESFTLRVECSKGTYIRTLCSDIGKMLGTGGCMGELERIACDNFTAENSHTVGQIENMIEKGDFGFITDAEAALTKYPAAHLEPSFGVRFLNGVDAGSKRFAVSEPLKEGSIVRVYIDGRFCAVAQEKNGTLHIRNRFVSPQEYAEGRGGEAKDE